MSLKSKYVLIGYITKFFYLNYREENCYPFEPYVLVLGALTHHSIWIFRVIFAGLKSDFDLLRLRSVERALQFEMGFVLDAVCNVDLLKDQFSLVRIVVVINPADLLL
jgi:hypothetical protein